MTDDIIVADDEGVLLPDSFGEDMRLDERGIVHVEPDDDRTLAEFADGH